MSGRDARALGCCFRRRERPAKALAGGRGGAGMSGRDTGAFGGCFRRRERPANPLAGGRVGAGMSGRDARAFGRCSRKRVMGAGGEAVVVGMRRRGIVQAGARLRWDGSVNFMPAMVVAATRCVPPRRQPRAPAHRPLLICADIQLQGGCLCGGSRAAAVSVSRSPAGCKGEDGQRQDGQDATSYRDPLATLLQPESRTSRAA